MVLEQFPKTQWTNLGCAHGFLLLFWGYRTYYGTGTRYTEANRNVGNIFQFIFVVLSWLLSFSVVFRTKSSRKFWRMRNNEYLWHRARQWIVKFPFIFFLCCESVCTWYVPVCSASYAINNLFIWFQKNYPPRMYVNVCKWCQVSPSESQSKLGRNHYFLTKSANRKYNPTTQPHGVCTKYRSFTTFCGGNSVDDPNRQKPRHIT